MTFDEVLHPLTTAQFLSDVGRQWPRTSGARGRFAHLAPWDRINEALSRDRFAGDRVRLVKNGKSISRESFLLTAAEADGSQVT